MMMMKINIGLWKDKRAFTGLEAAIVLTAFVVVAAVFSYVVLGAGFFTSDKAKEVIHSGVDQATSSIESTSSMIATGDGTAITSINITLGLTAGQNPVDLTAGQTVVSYIDAAQFKDNGTWSSHWLTGSADMIDPNEMVEITLDTSALDNPVTADTRFTIEIKPPEGASLVLTRTAPAEIITGKMNLN
jgi:flagellin FlaB